MPVLESLTPQQVAEEVLWRIQSYPETYDQGTWFMEYVPETDSFYTAGGLDQTDVEAWSIDLCSACVAGHTVAVALAGRGDGVTIEDIEDSAARFLRISHDVSAWLFDSERVKSEVVAALEFIRDGGVLTEDKVREIVKEGLVAGC